MMNRLQHAHAVRVSVLLLALSCGAGAPDGFSETEWSIVETLTRPLAADGTVSPPPDPANQWAEVGGVVALGQQLFFDRGLATLPDAGIASISCSDCHAPRTWYSDARPGPTSQGVDTGPTGRNAPGLIDVAWYGNFGVDGRGETLSTQAILAYTAKRTMAGDERALARALTRYRPQYERLFGELPSTPDPVALQPVMRNIAFAWAAYLRQLQSGDAPFDRYARGDRQALSPAQRRGLRLFLGRAGCVECHNGPNFSDSRPVDSRFHNLGLRQTGPDGVDTGRAEALKYLKTFAYRVNPVPQASPQDVGAFRTRSLRNVTETAPYFHAGQVATLREVIWFYNRGGDHEGVGVPSPFLVPLGLTEDEVGDLEAFIRSLTGTPPPAELGRDTSLGVTP